MDTILSSVYKHTYIAVTVAVILLPILLSPTVWWWILVRPYLVKYGPALEDWAAIIGRSDLLPKGFNRTRSEITRMRRISEMLKDELGRAAYIQSVRQWPSRIGAVFATWNSCRQIVASVHEEFTGPGYHNVGAPFDLPPPVVEGAKEEEDTLDISENVPTEEGHATEMESLLVNTDSADSGGVERPRRRLRSSSSEKISPRRSARIAK